MRKIAIIGGTGIDNPDTLKGFEKKIIETPFGKALCNIGTMSGNQVVFVSRHGVDHSVSPHKVNYEEPGYRGDFCYYRSRFPQPRDEGRSLRSLRQRAGLHQEPHQYLL
mgnify:CR=1 FL=1